MRLERQKSRFSFMDEAHRRRTLLDATHVGFRCAEIPLALVHVNGIEHLHSQPMRLHSGGEQGLVVLFKVQDARLVAFCDLNVREFGEEHQHGVADTAQFGSELLSDLVTAQGQEDSRAALKLLRG